MGDCGVAEKDLSEIKEPIGRCIVYFGGYPLARLPTFAAAAAQARVLGCFMSNGEISINEVETGIHFDVSLSPHFDRDGAASVHPNSCKQRPSGNPADQLVGSAMRFRRLQLDMTSDELAQAANVANAVIDDYEEGRKRAQAEHLLLIAKVLDVSPAYFFAQLEWG